MGCSTRSCSSATACELPDAKPRSEARLRRRRERRLLRNVAGGRFIGATIVAPRAGEVIHEAALALNAGMFPARVALTVHAYPTWSVAMQQAAAQFFVEVDGRRVRPARAT